MVEAIKRSPITGITPAARAPRAPRGCAAERSQQCTPGCSLQLSAAWPTAAWFKRFIFGRAASLSDLRDDVDAHGFLWGRRACQ